MTVGSLLATMSVGVALTLNQPATETVVPEIYPTCGVVTEVTETEMTFTDFMGYSWTIVDDPEDWDVGDRIAVIMSDNGTDIIFDDIVLQTKYCGWVY